MKKISLIIMLMAACLSFVAFNINPRENIYAYNDVGTTNPTVVPPQYVCEHQNICDSLLKAGFSVEQAKIMYAIAKCESGYDLTVKGDISLMNSKWSYSYGVYQIRLLNNPRGEWWRDSNFVEQSLDNQSLAAYAISGNGTNFTPWTTFANSCYQQYM